MFWEIALDVEQTTQAIALRMNVVIRQRIRVLNVWIVATAKATDRIASTRSVKNANTTGSASLERNAKTTRVPLSRRVVPPLRIAI